MLYTMILSLLVALAAAHRSLPSGVTCGNQFSSEADALTIPDTKISWATYRISTCDAPVMWLKGYFDAGQSMEFTLGLPELDRFEDVRTAVVIIGPGLPELVDEYDIVPQSVKDAIREGEGALLVAAPDDQSTCAHIQSEEMGKSSEVKDGRCHFYEEFGGSYNWVLQDDIAFAAEAGEHRFAVFTKNNVATKLWFACCAWPEDFVTPHEIPEPACPYCGTQPKLNQAWASHFYEHKTMAAFAGFPPAESCAGNANPPPPPAAEQCPPVSTSAPGEAPQPESCKLGCAKGECHSHNVFGECRYAIDWTGQAAKLNGNAVNTMILFKGDTLTFSSGSDEQMVYSLARLSDEAKFDACDFAGSASVALSEELDLGYEFVFAEEGTYYLAASIMCIPEADEDCQCQQGLKLKVEIKDASEGRHCHTHEKDFLNAMPTKKPEVPEKEPATVCAKGTTLVHNIGDRKCGAKRDQCAEFCAFPFSLAFLRGTKKGSCEGAGYAELVKDATFAIRGLDWEFGTKIFAKADGRRRLQAPNTVVQVPIQCSSGQVVAKTIGNEEYGAAADQCSEFCTPAFVLGFMDGASEGPCAPEYPTIVDLSKEVRPSGSPMDVTVRIYGKAEGTPAPAPVEAPTASVEPVEPVETTPSPTAPVTETTDGLVCFEGVSVHVVGSEDYGATPEQCSEFCMPEFAVQFTEGAVRGPCSGEEYPALVRTTTAQPEGSPQAFTVYVKGPAATELDTTQCHCHSYEEIKCGEDGQDLYDEHIDEITLYCQGVVSGEDETCPYLCFQPFEILHINYMECDTRPEHPLYQAIARTNKCHQAALAPSEYECDWMDEDESDEEEQQPIDSLEALQIYALAAEDAATCKQALGKWKAKNGGSCAPPKAKKVTCRRFKGEMCEMVKGCMPKKTGLKKKAKCVGKAFA